jgi:hypothetical protein
MANMLCGILGDEAIGRRGCRRVPSAGHAIERRSTDPLASSAERRVILFFCPIPAKILWFAYPRR